MASNVTLTALLLPARVAESADREPEPATTPEAASSTAPPRSAAERLFDVLVAGLKVIVNPFLTPVRLVDRPLPAALLPPEPPSAAPVVAVAAHERVDPAVQSAVGGVPATFEEITGLNITADAINDGAVASTSASREALLNPAVDLGSARDTIDSAAADNPIDPGPAPAPSRGFTSATQLADAGAVTVMLAASIEDPHHGAIEPIRDGAGRVERWRIRATSAARRFGVCPDDALATRYSRPSVGFCTGVLVAANRVLTARHCLRQVDDTSSIRVVFDYVTLPGGGTPAFLEDAKVRPVTVEAVGHGPDDDWAILAIDGAPAARKTPWPCGIGDHCQTGDTVFSVAHNLGMAQEYLGGVVIGGDDRRVRTDLDHFAGASGAPVFSRTSGRLLGIVIAGGFDFRRSRRGCVRTSTLHRADGVRENEVVLRVEQTPAGGGQPLDPD